MLRMFQFLGKISIRRYLVLAGMVAITLLLNYNNWQNQLQITARKERKHAANQARSEQLSLSEATPAAQPETEGAPAATSATDTRASSSSQSHTTSVTTSTPNNGIVEGSSTVNGGSLVFSPASLTLPLSGRAPLFTISSPDGSPVHPPVLSSDPTQLLSLTPQTSSGSPKATWSMQLSGNPKPGIYSVQLKATKTQGSGTVEYTGTLTLVVLL
jgi:hypothetical protein